MHIWLMLANDYAQVRELYVCPRSESHLTYMIDITLTVEFVLNDGVRWWELTRSSDGRLPTS